MTAMAEQLLQERSGNPRDSDPLDAVLAAAFGPAPAPPVGDLGADKTLGDFRIIREIGRGGMGIVYEADQVSLGRRVALKVLPFAATLDPRQLQRFKMEAQAAAQLHHTNIVPVYGVGCERGTHYFAMQFIEGQSLAALITELQGRATGTPANGDRADLSGSAPTRAAISTEHAENPAAFFRTVANLGVQAAEALEYAHTMGVVHRDIKPANLMVDQYGRLKILDFGIARVTEATRFGNQMTQLNVRIGTPGYMSPEQIEGEEIDRRSDIFAVGAVFYELIAYREAFSGANTRQIENKVLEARPARLTSLVPDLDPAIEEIVHKALAKDPRDRFQDAAEFEEALEKQRWKLGPGETPVPPGRHTPTPVRDSPARPHDSKANAAYQRSLVVYEQGAVEAARRFAIEALAEDPDHEDARAFIQRLGADLWPPPPPPSGVRTTAEATRLSTGSHPTSAFDPSAPTVLSTETVKPRTLRARAAAVWAQHGKTLQIAGIVLGVVAVLALGAWLAVSWFSPSGPRLTVTRPTGGTVWTTGITCGTDASDCSASFTKGDTVQLRADADEGYLFAGFTGDCTKSGRVHITRASTCGATFSPLPKESEKVTWALSVVKPTNGMIVGPGGLRCGSLDASCSVRYPEGTEVTLAAYPDQNFAFRGFTGDCGAKGDTVMKGARTCGATFVAEQKAARPSPVGPTIRDSQPRARDHSAVGSSGPGIDSLPGTLPSGNSTDPLAPPPEAPKTPLAPPLSPDELAKKDILKLIEEYREAYERFDLKGIQRTFPTAPVAALKSAFSGYSSLKYALEGSPEIQVDASRGIARVKAKFLLTPKVKVGSQPPYKREETFNLERQNGGVWLIHDWKPTPIN
jgi:serine/threonine protein kinase